MTQRLASPLVKKCEVVIFLFRTKTIHFCLNILILSRYPCSPFNANKVPVTHPIRPTQKGHTDFISLVQSKLTNLTFAKKFTLVFLCSVFRDRSDLRDDCWDCSQPEELHHLIRCHVVAEKPGLHTVSKYANATSSWKNAVKSTVRICRIQ
jgi:hypothetical protein